MLCICVHVQDDGDEEGLENLVQNLMKTNQELEETNRQYNKLSSEFSTASAVSGRQPLSFLPDVTGPVLYTLYLHISATY